MGKKEIEKADEKEIMFGAMHERGAKQAEMAEKLGLKQPSLSGNMNRSRTSLEFFVKFLDALDYDVVIVDRNSGEMAWKVEK